MLSLCKMPAIQKKQEMEILDKMKKNETFIKYCNYEVTTKNYHKQ